MLRYSYHIFATLVCFFSATLFLHAQLPTTKTENDHHYGQPGSKETETSADGNTTTVTYYDGKSPHHRREKQSIYRYPESARVDSTIYYYDSLGREERIISITKDFVVITSTQDDTFNPVTGQGIKGTKMEMDKFGHPKYFTWDSIKKEWVENPKVSENNNNEKDREYTNYDRYMTAILLISAAIIDEFGDDAFLGKGGNIEYTHRVSYRLGLTGEVGIDFGSVSGTNFTITQVLGGVSYFPGKDNSNLLFSPHILAGFVNTNTKTGSSTSSNTAFSVAVGADVVLKLSKRAGIAVGADYNPSFPAGKVQQNFRLFAGLALGLSKHGKSKSKNG